MKHIYKEESVWEVYSITAGDPWNDKFLFNLNSEAEFDSYIEKLESNGEDFAIHEDDEIEYHCCLLNNY